MTPTPFEALREVVRPEWIDENGHFNMGYYVVAFDLATHRGYDSDHPRVTGDGSTFDKLPFAGDFRFTPNRPKKK